MKTISELLRLLPEPYRTQALTHYYDQSVERLGREAAEKRMLEAQPQCFNVAHAIRGAFTWSETPQGVDYWSKVCLDHGHLPIQSVALSSVKKGDFLKRKLSSKTVWRRGHYDASSKTYSLVDTMDINREIFLKGTARVFVDGFEH